MIGFKTKDHPPQKKRVQALGKYEYVARRTARIFKIPIDSDDLVFLMIVGFCVLGVMVGMTLR